MSGHVSSKVLPMHMLLDNKKANFEFSLFTATPNLVSSGWRL